MRIISWGRNIYPTVRVTCKYCDAELELLKEDVEYKEYTLLRPYDKWYQFTCPCCNTINKLKRQEMDIVKPLFKN